MSNCIDLRSGFPCFLTEQCIRDTFYYPFVFEIQFCIESDRRKSSSRLGFVTVHQSFNKSMHMCMAVVSCEAHDMGVGNVQHLAHVDFFRLFAIDKCLDFVADSDS